MPRVLFERFLIRKYGLDSKYHKLVRLEINQATKRAGFAKERGEIYAKSKRIRLSLSLALQMAAACERRASTTPVDADFDSSIVPIQWHAVVDVIKQPSSIIGRAMKNKLVIRDWT